MQNNQNSSSALAINVIPPEKLTIILNDFITKTITHLNKLSINVEDKFQNFDQKLDDLEIMITLLESKLNSLPPEITSTYPQLQQCNLDDVNPVINIVQQQSVPNTQPSSSVPVAPPLGNVPVPPPLGNVPIPPPLGNIPVPPPLGTVNIKVPVPNMSNVNVPVPNVPVPNVPVPNVPGNNVPDNNEEEKKEEEVKELTPQEKLDKFLEEHEDLVGLHKMLKLKIPAGGVLQKATMSKMNMTLVNELIDLFKAVHPGA